MKVKFWFETNQVGSAESEVIDVVREWNLDPSSSTFDADLEECAKEWAGERYEFGWSKQEDAAQ